jgi:ribosomal protein S18 acetylase RimI-like enzyme
LHREIRLRALRDAPDAFGETAAEAEARPSSYWEHLTCSVTERGLHVMFLACDGDVVCGSAYGLTDREMEGAGRIGGTWVSPAYRRRGVAKALVDAVISWAGGREFDRVRLWAPEASTAAAALYRNSGFVSTGHRRPLRAGAAVQVVELERKLSGNLA